MKKNVTRTLNALALVAVALAAFTRLACRDGSSQINQPRADLPRAAETAPRRAAAVDVLLSLGDEARTFRDDGLGASVQAKAAALLWAEQPETARALFRRAWEQAARADEESRKKAEEARRRRVAGAEKGPAMFASNFRGEIINLAGVHDRALAEEFISQLAKTKEADSNDAARGIVTFAALDAPPADRQRLILAKDLLDAGDTTRALVFADPALSGPVNLSAVHFLSFLREKAPREADARFLSLCAAASSDPTSDANTVSLLSSYLLTPLVIVVFDPKGGRGSSSWRERPVQPPDASPQLKAAFFNTAASILLRPLPAPEQDHTSAGRAGLWMEITRLLPLFARYAPERVPELEARRAELVQDTPERSRDEKRLREWLPGEQSDDSPQDYTDALAKARTQNERDSVNASWAFTVSGKDFELARERALKIESQDVRTQLLAMLTLDEANRLVKKRDADGALKLAATGSLSPAQLVWLYSSCARLLKGRDPERARQLVEEATSAALLLDDRSRLRAHAMMAVAAATFDLDAAGGWPALEVAVRAANDAADFTGEGQAFVADVRTKVFVGSTWPDASTLDLKTLFAAVAKLDFQRAVAEAKGLSNDAARSTALLAAARAVLTKEPATRKK